MSRAVWKFPIPFHEDIEAPEGLVPLHVALQYDQLCLWAEVDPDAPKVTVPVHVRGTGHVYEPNGETYVGSVQDGSFVWHVFIGGAA